MYASCSILSAGCRLPTQPFCPETVLPRHYLFLYISPVLNPVNTPMIPHSKALFSLEMYKFFLSHLHIKLNVPSAHFPKMNHNVDFQNYVSNIHMRIAIYRANYLMLLLPSYTLYFFYFQIQRLFLTNYLSD